MSYILLAILALAFLIVLKVAKGIIKLLLIVLLVALLIGVFAGRDDIDNAAPTATTTTM